MLKQLANEFVKNLKIMFRNWTSISLLVISPLVLILLIGYTFSSEEVSGIKIGVISEENINLEPLVYNLSAYAALEKFDYVEDCLSEMALQNLHICIVLEGGLLRERNSTEPLDFEEATSGKVIYYYDNSRKRLSLALVQNIQGFFGLKAEQVSIESAESIIENIEQLIGFINERKGDIAQVKNESLAIKSELIERKAKLEQTRADFLPSYLVIKDLQGKMHNYSSSLYNVTDRLSTTTNDLFFVIQQFKDEEGNISFGFLENQTYNNNTVDTVQLSMLFGELEKELITLSDLINSTNSELNSTISAIDDMVTKLDNIKILLDEEIVRSDKYIAKIDQSIVRIDSVTQELDSKLDSLTTLHPSMAKKIVKPIMYEYNLLLKGAKNIQLSFPQLLVLIIMFIALLFSNIATLMEIHDKAYLRNIVAPVDEILYVMGMLFTSIVIVFLQIIVLFTVAQFKLGIVIAPVFWQISLITILLVIFFVLVGMAFAYLFKTVQSSILMTTFSALAFFLFSNTMAPVEAMPNFARFFSNHNPLVIGEYLIKQVQLFNTPLSYLLPRILLLVIYICVLFLVVVALAKIKSKRKE